MKEDINKKQLDKLKDHYKDMKIEKNMDTVVATVLFYDNKDEYPLAFIELPPFDTKTEQYQTFEIALNFLKFFNTEKIAFAIDTFYREMSVEEFEATRKGQKEFVPASLDAKSKSALSTTMAYRDTGKTEITMLPYSINDEGKIIFDDDNITQSENSDGMMVDMVKSAQDFFTTTFEEINSFNDDEKDTLGGELFKFIEQTAKYGFKINMSDEVFEDYNLSRFGGGKPA